MRLNGSVLEKWTRSPISGAVVSVNGILPVISDTTGQFSINTLQKSFVIQIVHIGYTTINESVYQFSDDVNIEFELVPVVRSL